ncbi:MAG TPA: hypothetical protein VJH96_00595 [Patescibacteria group bacterium]|nr:hypothetical protein [Patescibacteria group bacterium]
MTKEEMEKLAQKVIDKQATPEELLAFLRHINIGIEAMINIAETTNAYLKKQTT